MENCKKSVLKPFQYVFMNRQNYYYNKSNVAYFIMAYKYRGG